MSINCPHFNFCSGCDLDKNAAHPPLYEDVKAFFQKEIPLHVGHLTHWRTRAKLAVRGTAKDPHIGLFKRNSHEVIPIPNCKVQHPLINEAVEKIKNWILSNAIEPYNEQTHNGLLRYIQVVVHGTKVQVALVCTAPPPTPPAFDSVWININPAKTNTIFSQDWRHIVGDYWFVDEINGLPIDLLPGSFAQANPEMFGKLIQEIQKRILPHSRVVEFYAGTGIIGRSVADQSASVICNEINPASKLCFDQTPHPKVSYILSSATEALNLLNQADTVIVDPPRKGLDKALLQALQTHADPQQLIYVSCGWDSFKRDCATLSNWKLTHAETFLFFPGTNHLETLAFFKKI